MPLEIYRTPGQALLTEDVDGSRHDIEVVSVDKDETVYLKVTDPKGNVSTLTVPTKPDFRVGRMGFDVGIVPDHAPRWRGAVRLTARGPNEVRITRAELEDGT